MSHHISIWFLRDTIFFFLQSTALLWRRSGGGWWVAEGKICPKTLQNILKYQPRSFGKCSPLIQHVETCLPDKTPISPATWFSQPAVPGWWNKADTLRHLHTPLQQLRIGTKVSNWCERLLLHSPRARCCRPLLSLAFAPTWTPGIFWTKNGQTTACRSCAAC